MVFISVDDPSLHVDLTRLPKPACNQFIGRSAELEALNLAFNRRSQTGIVAIIADGGIGKSALTDKWLIELKKTNYSVDSNIPAIKRVFAWSFYAQGSHTNSQDFFSNALPFFGFAGKLPQNDDDKARELAKCLDKQAALLLLDGLEPLQQPPHIGGEIADVGMKEFLLQLHHHRHAQTFVLISSRQAIVELDGHDDYQAISLNTLNESEGAALLQILKVQGTGEECTTVSRDLNGHALSLVLLATLLKQYHEGDIRYAKELPPLDSDSKQSGHAKRVLTYYDSLLNDHEHRFMHCLALFDRPMYWREKQILFKSQATKATGLSSLVAKPKENYFQQLNQLSDRAWQNLQQDLETKGLLLRVRQGSHECSRMAHHERNQFIAVHPEPVAGFNYRTHWDTHPFIRQFFAEQFQQQQAEAFQQAHRVLFAYFQTVPETQQPDSLDELEPLYRAVIHGCLTGEYQKSLKNVYQTRILRGNKGYSIYKLGAYQQDLIALLAFFPQGWSQQPVCTDLTEVDQAWLLANASFCLMSLGRLTEAVAPREASIKLYVKTKNWQAAAISAENLTDLLVSLGKLQKAEKAAKLAVDYTLRSKDKRRKVASYSKLATVLHRLGDFEQAGQNFVQAEKLWQQVFSDYPHLSSIWGAQHCAYLLDIAGNIRDLEQILARAYYGLKIAQKQQSLMDIAFDHLTLARTYQTLQQAQSANTAFTNAILAIQKAGKIQYIPEFYLARADFYLSQSDLLNAEADIKTANYTINRCDMKLYAIDAVLLQGCFYLASNKVEAAFSCYQQAEMLIDETRYHLRDKALAELAQAIIEKTTNV